MTTPPNTVKRGHRPWMTLLGAGAAVGLGLLGWRPAGGSETVSETIGKPPGDGSLVQGVRLAHFAEGRTQWLLAAPSARRGDGKESYDFAQPHLTLYRETGEPVTVTARKGEVSDQPGTIHFREEVVTVDRHRRLTTEEVFYDPAKKELYTQKPFHLSETNRSDLWGVGFTLYQDRRELHVHQQVRVVIEPGRSSPP